MSRAIIEASTNVDEWKRSQLAPEKKSKLFVDFAELHNDRCNCGKKGHLKSRCSNIMPRRPRERERERGRLEDLLQRTTDIWINFQDYGKGRVAWKAHTAASNIKPDSHSLTRAHISRDAFCVFICIYVCIYSSHPLFLPHNTLV